VETGKAEMETLSAFDRHFVESLIRDFKKGGLELPDAQRQELQELLSKDVTCCSKYKNNLGEDATTLKFKRYKNNMEFTIDNYANYALPLSCYYKEYIYMCVAQTITTCYFLLKSNANKLKKQVRVAGTSPELHGRKSRPFR
jgi:Zn-dependent oligopeptidase